MAMFVRIHPKDKRTGHLVERYIYRGIKFEEKKGWYRVSDALASELKDMVQDPNAPVPVNVFQVATEEEAKALEQKDYERENPTRKISEAVEGAQTVPDKRLEPLPEKEGLDEDEDELEPEEEVEEVGDASDEDKLFS
jgi:hypothetical protein